MTDQKLMTAAETAALCNSIRTDLKDIEAELDYLTWFKQHADFGPADSDVHQIMDMQYEEETGKTVPTDWTQEGE
jgi:hypothetical protein